jgi:hypothetical protein
MNTETDENDGRNNVWGVFHTAVCPHASVLSTSDSPNPLGTRGRAQRPPSRVFLLLVTLSLSLSLCIPKNVSQSSLDRIFWHCRARVTLKSGLSGLGLRAGRMKASSRWCFLHEACELALNELAKREAWCTRCSCFTETVSKNEVVLRTLSSSRPEARGPKARISAAPQSPCEL